MDSKGSAYKEVGRDKPDYEYGRDSWEFFKTTLKALRPDVEFVSEQWNPSPGTTDFSKWISAVMATDAEGLFTVNWAVEAITLHKQAAELGLYKKLKAVFNPMGYSMDVAYGLGKDYPRLEYGTWVSGRYMWFYPPTEINKRFVDALHTKMGKASSIFCRDNVYCYIYDKDSHREGWHSRSRYPYKDYGKHGCDITGWG